jgi:hypothetical protein
MTLKEKFEWMKKESSNRLTKLLWLDTFGRLCFGKKGYNAADCFKKREDKKNKLGWRNMREASQGTCHGCGKKGDKKTKCYQLKYKKRSGIKRSSAYTGSNE